MLRSKVHKAVRTSALRFSGTNWIFTVSERITKGKSHWSLVGAGTGGYPEPRRRRDWNAHLRQVRQTLHGTVSN